MQALTLTDNACLGTYPNCEFSIPTEMLASHVEELSLRYPQAQGMAGQLRNWGQLRSLSVTESANEEWVPAAPELCALLQDLAGATQLRSMTWVLPKGREAETRPHRKLGRAVARLRAERPELQLRLRLE